MNLQLRGGSAAYAVFNSVTSDDGSSEAFSAMNMDYFEDEELKEDFKTLKIFG